MEKYAALPRPDFTEAFEYNMANTQNFKGRSRRSEFWPTFLIAEAFILIVRFFSMMVAEGNFLVDLIFLFVELGIALSVMSLKVRRLHDVGLSGKWVIADIVTYILFSLGIDFFLIVTTARIIVVAVITICGFLDSQKTANAYGPSPKYVRVTEDEAVSE